MSLSWQNEWAFYGNVNEPFMAMWMSLLWQCEWAFHGNMNEPAMAIWMSQRWQYEWASDGNMNEVHVNRNEMLKWLKSMWNDKMIKEYVKC